MAQIQFSNVTFGYGGPPLIDGASLSVDRGERIALVGRNGAGKSTLLRLMSGEERPLDGEVTRSSRLTLAAQWQDVPRDLAGSVFDVVASGLGKRGQALAEYLACLDDPSRIDELEKLQERVQAVDGWELHRDVEETITRLSLDGTWQVEQLSAGVQRRTLLARALVSQPDVLLLDEPTNHLDIDSILWLEELLSRYPGTVVFVTHDRRFLRNVATAMFDLDRGRVRRFGSDYDAYLEQRSELLEQEARNLDLLDKKLAQEEAWIRRGIKARRTRNEGRVRALERLREERANVRSGPGTMSAKVVEADRSGRLVIETNELSFRYGDKQIVDGLSVKIFRGDRVGLLGPNGVGKTTLLRLLLGELAPDRGTVHHGTQLQVLYFDQVKAQLELEKTVAENVGQGREHVGPEGNSRHLYGYLQDFLFSPEEANKRVSALSGGERNRVLLAKLFTEPANVLVLDEPTNDLDVESLELLEEILTDFVGAVLLVSHDREFVDRVVTTSLVFEPGGSVREFVGSYEDYMGTLRSKKSKPASVKANGAKSSGKPKSAKEPGPKAKKLTYKEQKELEGLPATIETLEEDKSALETSMASPDFYKQEKDAIAKALNALEALNAQLADAYARWEELEARAG